MKPRTAIGDLFDDVRVHLPILGVLDCARPLGPQRPSERLTEIPPSPVAITCR